MTVATDNCHPRQGITLFGAGDVDYAVTRITHPEVGDTRSMAVILQGLHLRPGDRVGNGQVLVDGWNIMVSGSDGSLRPEYADPPLPQAAEGLRAGYLMYIMTVNEEYIGTVRHRPDKVSIPDLVKECLSAHCLSLKLRL
jgi:hypothetical protein